MEGCVTPSKMAKSDTKKDATKKATVAKKSNKKGESYRQDY